MTAAQNEHPVPEKTSYFRAAAGSFCGTAIFERLIRQGMVRTVFHTVLTVILLGIFVAFMQRSRYTPLITETAGHFRTIFGGIQFDSNGIRPVNTPEKSNYQLLEFGGLLTYAPSGAPVLPEKSGFADYRFTLAWFPTGAAMIVPAGDGRFAVSVLRPGKYAGNQQFCSSAELDRMLARMGAEKAADMKIENFAAQMTPEEIAGAMRTVTASCLFFLFIGEAAFQILLCIVIFVGFFCLTSGRKRSLKWGELVRIALYAGFPALFVAACFAALDLTGVLSFGTVYVIGTIGYFLVIVNKMEQSRHAGQA